MDPLNCDAIDPMQFLQWEDDSNHSSGVCVENADEHTSLITGPSENIYHHQPAILADEPENDAHKQEAATAINEENVSNSAISSNEKDVATSALHVYCNNISPVSSHMPSGFSFNGSIGDLPLMPTDMVSAAAISAASTKQQSASWNDQPLMSLGYNEANSELSASEINAQIQARSSVAPAPTSSAMAMAPPPVGKKKANVSKKRPSSKRGKSTTGSNVAQSSKNSLPPFMLFDAPCELRFNYAQTQQRHNIPLQVGANDLHYGVPVNGFHPQLNAQDNPPVQMIDARHCRKKTNVSSERNEREQKRAHKITELIEELRVSMIDGGWNVQIKSKYHTLLTCQDYVRHLVQTNKELEEKVRKVKQDAELKNIDLGTSEAESISSINSEVSIARKRRHIIRSLADTSTKRSRKLMMKPHSDRKTYVSDTANTCSASTVATDCESAVDAVTSVHNVEDDVPLMVRPESCNSKTLNDPVPWTSPEKVCFDDVFLDSFIPQIIATTSGRIISWNKAFLKITSMSRFQLKNMTLFSLVRLDCMSKLFAFIANELNGKVSNDTESDYERLMPCIKFESKEDLQLFMRVSLVDDINPNVRCLNVLFTDCERASEGKMGFVTDKLIARMY